MGAMEEGVMAKELLPDALWARIALLLPPEQPKLSSANHVQLARAVGLDRRARPLLY